VSDGLTGKRSLDHDTIDALPAPCDALHLVVLGKTCAPKKNKETSIHPSNKMGMNGAGASITFLWEGFPLATGSQNIENRLEYRTGWYRLPPATGLAPVGLVCISLGRRYQ
jgi:hypothetical protein